MTVGERFQHAYNAFVGSEKEEASPSYTDKGPSYAHRPDRIRLTRGNERSIITSIFNKIAMDCAAVDIVHAQLDEDGRFDYIRKSTLNEVLSVEANIDQTGRAMLQDVFLSMLDEGKVAILPTDTSVNPKTGTFKVLTARTAKIEEWYPKDVRIRAYNENRGRQESIVRSKRSLAIIESPLYSVINQPNSTMQRLVSKLVLLDAVDRQSGSGKLDLIIQLPYSTRTESKRMQAERRRSDIEMQLVDSKYGIAYTDSSEKVTQLNRSVENNLMGQVEYLTNLLFSQLGLTQSILDGTADENTMTNYYARTIEPLISAVTEELHRKFLSKTARSQGQAILFFRDPFKLIPLTKVAELADKLNRNEILTSNEIRQIIGRKPVKDPRADELVNKNISAPKEEGSTSSTILDKEENQNGETDE